MSNNNDWGKIYCHSWFGDERNDDTLENDAAPECLLDVPIEDLLVNDGNLGPNSMRMSIPVKETEQIKLEPIKVVTKENVIPKLKWYQKIIKWVKNIFA